MTFHYFGYGSNMLTERLRARCPSAKPIGVAEAPDHVLEFSKRSTDGSGKATLGRSAGSGECSFGVVFEILESERTELDKAEGTEDGGYQRCDGFPVRLVKDGKCLSTSCYLATDRDDSLNPYDWYLALTIAGAVRHGLNDDYIAPLKRTPYIVDNDRERPSRRKAVKALRKAGSGDYCQLFQTT